MAQRALATFDVLYLLGAIPVLSFALYSVNDIYDYESDVNNDRKKLAIMGGVLDKCYWPTFTKLSIASCILVVLFPIVFGYLIVALCSVLGLMIGIGYSIPPLRFKTLPGGDIAANTLGFVTLFLVGLLQNPSLELITFAAPYLLISSLMVVAWSLLFLSVDISPDKRARDATTSVRIGSVPSYVLSAVGYITCGYIMQYFVLSPVVSFLLYASALLSLLPILPGLPKTPKIAPVIIIIITLLNIIAYCSLYTRFVL